MHSSDMLTDIETFIRIGLSGNMMVGYRA